MEVSLVFGRQLVAVGRRKRFSYLAIYLSRNSSEHLSTTRVTACGLAILIVSVVRMCISGSQSRRRGGYDRLCMSAKRLRDV